MQYEISKKWLDESFAVPCACEAFFAEAGECELRVLLFAAARGVFDAEEIVEKLNLPESDVREALAFWRGAGLFSKTRTAEKKTPQKPKEEERVKIVSSRPTYSSLDLAAAVENSTEFKSLVDFAEKRLEKLFNRAELSILYSFVNFYEMPVDVVMLCIEACAKEGKKSLRYIEKLIIALADDGITAYEDADAYFARRAEYLSFEGKIRALCGFTSRALTAAEKKIITSWKDEYKYGEAEVQEAYEKTVNAIAKPSLTYMNKVLLTMREQPRDDGERGIKKTYDTQSRFEAAVKRTKKKRGEEKA